MLVGVVGKPSAGKSTFFSAATMVDVPRAAYPFTTIEPNRGVGFVRVECADKDFDVQCNPRAGHCINHMRFVPVELLDVAGLVPGAHEGKGLGNKFLDDLRQADVLIHVVDASGSTNEKGESVPTGSHDPCMDIRFLEEELELWMLAILENNWGKFARAPITGKQQLVEAIGRGLSGLGVKDIQVETALRKLSLLDLKPVQWSEENKRQFVTELRKLSKPIVIAANKMDVSTSTENLKKMQESFPHLLIVPCAAESELSLKKAAKAGLIDYVAGNASFTKKGTLSPEQEKALSFIEEKVLRPLNGTGVQTVLDQTVLHALGYIAIFPGGTKGLTDSQGRVLPDCFLMPPHSTALDFAFRLHTDFGKNFIKAINVKTRMLLGKEHPLSHRDVIEIVSGK